MRYLLSITFSIFIFSATVAAKRQPPPFAQSLSESQVVDVLVWTSSTQTQYLGFDWINSYCFGRVLGCAVTDEPATNQYSYGEVLFRSGDWLIYATCVGGAPGAQIEWLAPCWKPDTRVEVSAAKDARTILIGDPGTKQHRWRGHTYSVVSAFDASTKEVWGQGTLEDWRIVLAAIDIETEFKSMSVDDQLRWAGKISALRTTDLLNADNLEKLLAEMRSSKPHQN
jgi:hypothetical protein